MFPANKFENILWVMAIAHVLHTWEPLRTCHNLCPPIITTMISSHGRTSMKADFAFVYFIHKFSVSCYSLLPPYLTFIHILDKQGSICTCRALLLSVFFFKLNFLWLTSFFLLRKVRRYPSELLSKGFLINRPGT